MTGRIGRALAGKRLWCLDTAPFIYLIQENKDYLPLCRWIFGRIDDGHAFGLSSFLTLSEVLVQPFKSGATQIAEKYRDILLHNTRFSLYPVDEEVAEMAARLRAKHDKLRTPDAIHLATAICRKADVFLTNDTGIPQSEQVEIIQLGDYLDASSKRGTS